jgi:hypothetical protein
MLEGKKGYARWGRMWVALPRKSSAAFVEIASGADGNFLGDDAEPHRPPWLKRELNSGIQKPDAPAPKSPALDIS